MNQRQFCEWRDRNGFSPQIEEYVQRIRSGNPVRRVSPGVTHSWGRYPSRKMGQTIEFESRTIELPAILMHEHDDLTLEYYEQPYQLKCAYQDDTGRNRAYMHVPDLFVLRMDGIRFEEWKDERRLVKLSQKSPRRYYFADGRWHHEPAERSAQAMGVGYMLRSSIELNANEYRNIRFLEDHL